jgi:hypothetical protein
VLEEFPFALALQLGHCRLGFPLGPGYCQLLAGDRRFPALFCFFLQIAFLFPSANFQGCALIFQLPAAYLPI